MKRATSEARMCLIRMNKVCNIFHLVSMNNMTWCKKGKEQQKLGEELTLEIFLSSIPTAEQERREEPWGRGAEEGGGKGHRAEGSSTLHLSLIPFSPCFEGLSFYLTQLPFFPSLLHALRLHITYIPPMFLLYPFPHDFLPLIPSATGRPPLSSPLFLSCSSCSSSPHAVDLHPASTPLCKTFLSLSSPLLYNVPHPTYPPLVLLLSPLLPSSTLLLFSPSRCPLPPSVCLSLLFPGLVKQCPYSPASSAQRLL